MVQRKETCLWETKSWNCIFQHWHVEITVYVALLVAVIQLCTERVDILFCYVCVLTSLQAVLLLSIVGFLVLFAKRDEARFVYFFSFMSIWQHYAHGMAVLLRRPISSSSVRDALLAENYNYRWSSGVLEYRGSMKGEQGHKNSWSSKRWTSKENTVGATASCAFRRWLP